MDGYVYNGPVGCGACSAVIFIPSEMPESFVHTSAVGRLVNSTRCEVEGILLGIEVAIRFLIQCQARKTQETVYIMCDCISAIESVINKVQLLKYPVIFQRLQALIN